MNPYSNVYLLYDERFKLHRPLSPTTDQLAAHQHQYESNDPADPNFVYERPARAEAIYRSLCKLEQDLMRYNHQLYPVSLMHNALGRFHRLACPMVKRETVELVHSPQHYDHLLRTSMLSDSELRRLNEEDGDLYFTRDTFLAAALACGGVVECVNAVTKESPASTRAIAIVRPPGHHATREKAMGFCYFNNVAVAAKHAIHTGRASRVFILDWDIHHGNGIQELTYDDPDIFYCSIHRSSSKKAYFYPGTGRHKETGSCTAAATNLNIPFDTQGMGNVEYAAAFLEVVLPAMVHYNPDLVLIACGLDAAKGDLLGDFGLSPEMFHTMTRSVIETAGARTSIVVALEGGYQLDVISRCMDEVALALLDEPSRASAATLGSSDSMASPMETTNRLSQYWNHDQMKLVPTMSNETTKIAVKSIKKSARSLARSHWTALDASSCIQSPCGYSCACHARKRYVKRPALLDSDRYPVKTQYPSWDNLSNMEDEDSDQEVRQDPICSMSD